MTSKIAKSSPRHASAAIKSPGSKPTAVAKSASAKFRRDEMSTGRGSAHRSAARKAIAPIALGADEQAAFDTKIAALRLAVVDGMPGAQEELTAVLRDRSGIQKAVQDVEQKIAANEDPATWANVKPRSVALAEQAELRAQLRQQLSDLTKFGVKVAGMNPKERQDLQNFFGLAKEDPEAFKRFTSGQASAPAPAPSTTPVQAPTPVSTGAPANIQAAIDFGLTQRGAPYVGGASPYRFGTPGDGNTYQQQGQHPYVSQRGVVGYDCSGLMVTMLKRAGINLSGMASSRAMLKLPEVAKDQLQPGDLLVKNGHVAMYIGDGKIIESVPGGVRVAPASKYVNDPDYSGHRPG